jgi:hypothetical protein
MPFLSTYGGKVFLYPSHYAFGKFMKFFSTLPKVEAHVFSLENILKVVIIFVLFVCFGLCNKVPFFICFFVLQCMAKETRKVVWILTASTAYDWGKYQRQVLNVIQKVNIGFFFFFFLVKLS